MVCVGLVFVFVVVLSKIKKEEKKKSQIVELWLCVETSRMSPQPVALPPRTQDE
jgi:hypothetical protein